MSLLAPLALLLQLDAAAYTFRIPDRAEPVVHGELRLDGLEGPLGLHVPARFAFTVLDEPRLEGEVLARTVEGTPLELERTSPYTWRLSPGTAQTAFVTWSARIDHRDLPEFARSEYEAPYLLEDHGLLTMGAIVLAPDDLGAASISVRFEPPDGWPVLAPWPEPEPGLYRPDANGLLSDLVALGPWAVEEVGLDGLDLVIGFAPGRYPLQQRILETVPWIVETELALFGGAPQDRYVFLFVAPPDTPGTSGFGGSPKTGSMTMYATSNLPEAQTLEGIEHLIAHEYHHTWGRARTVLPDELRFVTEGFTDWFAYLVPWRLELRNDAQLLATLEGKLAELEQSLAVCGLPLVEAGGPVFFEGGSAYSATYSGGLVLAALVDLALGTDGDERGVDRLLRSFYEDPRWRDGTAPTLDDFLAAVEEEGGTELRELAAAFVTSPTPPDLVEAFATIGVELVREELPADLSLRANLDGTRLLGIDSSDVALRVGLRSNDLLLEVNGQEVGDERSLRSAWARPQDGRIRVTYLRGDREESLDVEVPAAVRYRLPATLAADLRP